MTDSRPGATVAFPCPKCGGRMGVYWSADHRFGYFRRYRKCKKCGTTMITIEVPLAVYTRLSSAASEA